MSRLALIASAAVLPLLIGACQRERQAAAPVNDAAATASGPDNPAPVEAALISSDGNPIGKVTLSEDPNGVTVKVEAGGLSAGNHGLHLHEKGDCALPDFKAAAGHLNPTGKEHGRDNPNGSHLGDLANLNADAKGHAASSFLVSGAQLRGANGLIDADGVALVVHADADDYKTDPSGNSGDRIACAAFN